MNLVVFSRKTLENPSRPTQDVKTTLFEYFDILSGCAIHNFMHINGI